MAAAHALMTDWPTYCVVQLVWTLSARQWLTAIQPLQLGYLGASCVASLRALESLLPTYRARAARALRQDHRIPDLLDALAALLGQLRQSIALHFPSPPNRLAVDVHALLAD